MVALAGTLGRFHVAQQRVHLGQAQAPVGAHRAVAGHRRQHVIAGFLDTARIALRHQIGDHVADQLRRVGAVEQRRKALDQHALRTAALQFEAQFGETRGLILDAGRFALTPGSTSAGTEVLHLSVTLSTADGPAPTEGASAGAFGLGFEAPSGKLPGKAFFTLTSGRHVEIAVKLVRIE